MKLFLSIFFPSVISSWNSVFNKNTEKPKKDFTIQSEPSIVCNKYMYSFIYFSILVFTKFMKVNAEVGVCNIQSQLQYSAVKQLASDYQKVKAQVTTALMTAGESEGFILFFKVHIFWEGHKILWNLHQLFVLHCDEKKNRIKTISID